MNMFDPELMRRASQNMNPDMVKQASEKMKGMSDEELQRMFRQTGLNADPKMMRQMQQTIDQMDNKQLEQMTNMAKNMDPNLMYKNNPQNQPQPKTQSNNDSQFQFYSNIVTLKNQGSKKFQEGNYDEASKNYLEAILEIEENKLNKPTGQKEYELRQLEIMCRNNYCTVKAKQQDYHSVVIHASSVLGLDPENLKANFRLGQAHYNLGRYEKALPFLTKAKNGSPDDKQINDTWQACQSKCQPTTTTEEVKKQEEKPEQKITEEKPVQKQEKPVEKQENTYKQKEYKEEKKIEEKPDFVIKEEKTTPQQSTYETEEERELRLLQEKIKELQQKEQSLKKKVEQKSTVVNQTTPVPPVQSQMDKQQIKKSQEALKNMSTEQMDSMTSMLKNMDTSFLKQMYKAQGIDMTDSQIEMMKSMVTPDMLKTAASMDVNNGYPQQQNVYQSTQAQQKPKTQEGADQQIQQEQQFQQGPQAQAMPDISNLMNNPEMISTMLDMVVSNPEIIKMVCQQLGPGNPLATFLQNQTPEQLKKKVSMIKKCIPVFRVGYKGFSFIKRNFRVVMLLVVASIVYRFI